MLFTARIVRNAEIKTVKDNRQVVSFAVAINDQYKSKNSSVPVKTTLFVNCSYWVNTAIAPYLVKGTIIEVEGRLSVDAYQSCNDVKATLNAHINSIKLHGKGSGVEATQQEQPVKLVVAPNETDDLPF
jgi:single-strand DNA-binding protein